VIIRARRFTVAFVAGALVLSGCTFLERSDVRNDGAARTPGETFGDDVSADGRFVSQTASVPLVDGDTNGVSDVYVRDHLANTTERISVAADGGDADARSFTSSISADGRYVLFSSEAQNLLAGETPDGTNLFLRDRTAGSTIRVPVTYDGEAPNELLGDTDLSGNGRVALFETRAGNILEDGSIGGVNVYVHDLDAATTERISVSSSGEPADLQSQAAGISGDGDRVVFMTAAENLGSGTPGRNQVYVRRRSAHTTELVSAAPSGTGAVQGAGAGKDAITNNGRYVVFSSTDSGLTGQGPDNVTTPFVRDLQTGGLTRVVPTGGLPMPLLFLPVGISEDARFVLAAGLLPPSEIQAFVVDRADGTLSRAGSGPAQTRLPTGTLPVAISADGAYAVFDTSDPALVPGPAVPNSHGGTFLRSTVVPTLSIASPSTAARGATVDVTLTGTYLFADPFVSFGGDGVTVTDVAVLDEQHVRVTVQVASDAPPGKRTALLQNQGTGAGPRSGGLTVLVDALTVA
jgi:hypothetical protein